MDKFIVYFTILSYECDGEEFTNFKEARKFFDKHTHLDYVRNIKMVRYDNNKEIPVMEFDAAIWGVYAYSGEQRIGIYRTKDYKMANDYFENAIRDKSLSRVVMELESSTYKELQCEFIRHSVGE